MCAFEEEIDLKKTPKKHVIKEKCYYPHTQSISV
jgi:hypothetical protein